MRNLFCLGACVWLAACAESKFVGSRDGSSHSDRATDSSVFDGGPGDKPGGGGDSAALKKFGEPCTDKSQCESKICIFSGTTGVCSVTCPAIGCPAGYGCYDVLGGGVDPQVVVKICVPEQKFLCLKCDNNNQCGSPLGKDLCLPYGTSSYCGKDCSAISCPPTYVCKDVPRGDAGTAKQCVPSTGSCECMAGSPPSTTPCNITTPLGTTCLGTHVCNGAQGYGPCTPPSATDLPDDSFVDSNCDGIDGEVSQAIFVDTLTGNDNNPGTMAKPVVSIPKGIQLAQAGGKAQILVSKGTYPPLQLISGAKIYGGYDAANNWQRAGSNVTTISGGNPAVEAKNVADAWLDHFTIISDDAGPGKPGSSSFGVSIISSSGPVVLHSVSVTAGKGNDGVNGQSFSKGADGTKGGKGGDGCKCGGTQPGGSGGTSACNAGGSGGTGVSGSGNAPQASPGFGPNPGGGGSGGCGCSKSCFSTCGCGGRCSPTTGGTGGNGASGSNGGQAAQVGDITGGDYVPASGANGTDGSDGSGGGGGGGGAGSDGPCLCNTYCGGGGGGGGGAGCRGLGGTKGTGGGASVAVFVFGSTVLVEKCKLSTSNGGKGGDGGNGGLGGGAGLGGDPGAPSSDGQQGAPGGPGGPGGTGGSGSGGSGGPSFCVFSKGSTVTLLNNTYTPGAGGVAGAGGSNTALGQAPAGQAGLSSSVYQL